MVFGILEILLGALSWLFVPLMLLSLAFAGRHGAAATPPMIVPIVGLYALSGTILIWLGIGSILARRWARALWVCLSGVGFATGLLALPFAGYMTVIEIPRSMAANGPPGQAAMVPFVQIILLIFLAFIYVIIPVSLFLFYRSPHVKRTCEVKDPRERWTDRCPLPVLALSLFTAFGACMMVLILPFFCAVPVFGLVVTGPPGQILMLAYAATMLYAAWGMYRLKIGAWWLCLGVMLVVAISGAITLAHVNLREIYLSMGFDAATASRAGELAQRMKWLSLVWFLPWLGWVLYVRRYFVRVSQTETGI